MNHRNILSSLDVSLTNCRTDQSPTNASLAHLNARDSPRKQRKWKTKKRFALFKLLTLTCLHGASRGQVSLYLHLQKSGNDSFIPTGLVLLCVPAGPTGALPCHLS